MEYSKLEKKIIRKGFDDFRKELNEASKPMLKVLKKYRLFNNHELLNKITLYCPSDVNYTAVKIPDDKELASMEMAILENFMNEFENFKKQKNE